jgi:hypothetical protein
MLDKNIIGESQSPWSAPAILVPKKSLGGRPKYRFCVHFRALNVVIKFDPYPLPTYEKLTPLCMVQNTFRFYIVIVDFGR